MLSKFKELLYIEIYISWKRLRELKVVYLSFGILTYFAVDGLECDRKQGQRERV